MNTAHYCLENKIKNIYLYPQVFEKFSRRYKKFYFDQCYIFFPDPWPKKRHHKRRLVNYNFLKSLIDYCNKGGQVFFGTDNTDYFDDVLKSTKLIMASKIIKIKLLKKTPTVITKYHHRALKLNNIISFLKIDKL